MRHLSMNAGLVTVLLASAACTPAVPLPPPAPALLPAPSPAPGASSLRPPAPLEHSAIPAFFEIGADVALPSGDRVDTTAWLRRLLERGSEPFDASGRRASGPSPRLLVYAEPDPVTRQVVRHALSLPPATPYSRNDRVVAFWSRPALGFDFGVAGSRSFGGLSAPGDAASPRRLRAAFEPAGDNAQAFELIYEVDGTDLRLFEHKGLIPGLPVAFERFTLYRPDPRDASAEPSVFTAARPLELRLGLLPERADGWARVSTFELSRHRVIIATDAAGASFFLAADLALTPSVYFGNVAADLVIDGAAFQSARGAESLHAENVAAVALLLPDARRGGVLTGKLDSVADVQGYIERSVTFLREHDAALADLRAHGASAQRFLRHYTRTFLASHRSRRDPRLFTQLPYGDAGYPENAASSPATIRYGSDQASVLLGLVHHQRQSGDREILEVIGGLTEASLDALMPSGAVHESRFDAMSIGLEQDPETGRADALLDNGAVSVSFNHRRLVARAGQGREPGATWGAFSLRVDDRIESVDDGRYSFVVDADSLPSRVRADRSELAVARRFTRADGRLSIWETATLARGVPALRVDERVENSGASPVRLGDVRLAVGDFFHYGDGALEASQNRYGMSPVIDGVPLHVGLWMEGATETLWGDAFAPGWVDLSDAYHRSGSRFIVVYGYDRGQLYYIPERADEVWLYNAEPARTGGHAGWTTLELRYRVEQTLAPGASHASPPIYTYTLRAPLFSADEDNLPDALEQLAPRWADMLQSSVEAIHLEGARRGLEPSLGRERLRVPSPLHTSLTPDRASVALHVGWAMAADLLRDRARQAPGGEARRELDRRARLARAGALRGAAHDLATLTHLRNRPDLMPSYGTGRNYGYHVLLFDWAARETGEPAFADALAHVADTIASGEADGGLQVIDPRKQNHGAYVQNELERARGASLIDDQGIKLWALRVAYDRTRDARYRRSAELHIDHWIRIRDEDHLFYGISKLFERYVVTGAAQQRTPLGHQALMVGLAAWSSVLPRARELYARGLANASTCHPVHALGTTGLLGGVFPDERTLHFDTDAELGGMFLLAMTLDAARRGTR